MADRQAPFQFPAGATATSLAGRVMDAMRYVVRGVDPTWMGPGQPMVPVVTDTPDQGVAGRRYDYPVGVNMRTAPRGEESVTFGQMRALADSYDILRIVIETRKDQFGKLKWKMRRKDGGDEDAAVEAVTAFFMSPDKEHGFDDWLRMMLEDMLVIDAVSIYPRMTKGGQLYSLELIDGGTIKRVLDPMGRTPMTPDPAYQQILKGMPAIDYSRDELLYRPRNLRTNRIYGYSPVEQIIMTVNIALRRQLNQLSYYTEGNIPNLLFGTPPEWTPDQIAIFQAWFDSLFSEGQSKNVAKFIPGGIAPIDTKAQALKDEMDEWLARIVCYAFNVSNQAFVKQMNRATAETAHQQSLEEGMAPLQRYVKSVIDQCIAGPLAMPDIEFVWDEEESVDPLVAAQVAEIYVAGGVITPDEVRADLGRPPLTPKQKDELKPAPPPMLGHNGGPALDGNEPADAGAAGKVNKAVKKKIDPDQVEKNLTNILTLFFIKQSAVVAAQLGKKLKLGKAAAMDDGAQQGAFDAVDEVQFDWAPLVKKIMPGMVVVAVDAGGEALDELKLFDADVVALMTKDATEVARDRAAELVGMKWDGASLVPNPDARWQITEATRDMIRSTATDAVQNGWSNQRLAAELKDAHAFSAERAINIARTETARAQTDGSIAGWKASGVVGGKQWSAAPDCCDICQELDGKIVGLDEEFEDGDPPLHPSCRCGLDAVLTDDMEADDGKE